MKANSEGQPGPFDYNRTHADGANTLADAVKPYGGIIMWRSFVYGAKHKGEDRVKQAVSEFAELDGKFRDNVILQSKNGPLDFQPTSSRVSHTLLSSIISTRRSRWPSCRSRRSIWDSRDIWCIWLRCGVSSSSSLPRRNLWVSLV